MRTLLRLAPPAAILLTILAFHLAPAAADGDAFAEWAWQRPVVITNGGASDLADFPVQVLLDGTFDYAKALADGADLRASDEVTGAEFPLWIESWDPTGGSAELWVRVPAIPAGGYAAVRLHYGNPNAVPASTRLGRWEVYDDFDGAAVDEDTWEVVHVDDEGHGYGGSVGVSNGELVVSGGEHHITDGVTSRRSFSAGGGVLRAEMTGFVRSGNNFNYAGPFFGIQRDGVGYVSYVNRGGFDYSGYKYEWFYTQNSGATTEANLGTPHQSATSVALEYTGTSARIEIEGVEEATSTTNVPPDAGDFVLKVYICSPYTGAMTARMDRIVVSKTVDPAPVATVGVEGGTGNAPPTVPALLGPDDAAWLTTDEPAFRWANSEDPDGDEVTYTLEMNRDGDFEAETTMRHAGLVGDVSGETAFAHEAMVQGLWSWRVVATDGDLAVASAARTLRIDTIAPDAALVDTPDAGGPIAGTAEEGATVRLWVDGDEVAATAVEGGAFAFPPPVLSPGTHRIHVTVEDEAGNVSTDPDVYVLTVARSRNVYRETDPALVHDGGTSLRIERSGYHDFRLALPAGDHPVSLWVRTEGEATDISFRVLGPTGATLVTLVPDGMVDGDWARWGGVVEGLTGPTILSLRVETTLAVGSTWVDDVVAGD